VPSKPFVEHLHADIVDIHSGKSCRSQRNLLPGFDDQFVRGIPLLGFGAVEQRAGLDVDDNIALCADKFSTLGGAFKT
jgi:hypothetical protein